MPHLALLFAALILLEHLALQVNLQGAVYSVLLSCTLGSSRRCAQAHPLLNDRLLIFSELALVELPEEIVRPVTAKRATSGRRFGQRTLQPRPRTEPSALADGAAPGLQSRNTV